MIRAPLSLMVLVVLVSGCAANKDLASYYERYVSSIAGNPPYRVHRIPRDNHLLHVVEFRPPRPLSGPTLILMHGFPDSAHLYDRLAPLLAVEHRVIAFDFLGWGNSETPAEHNYNVASLRRDLEVVIDHFSLDSVILVVHDASGPPGIDWALDHPSRTSGLVLLNTLYAPSEHRVMPPAIKRLSTPGLRRNLFAFGIQQSDGQWQQGLMRQVSEFLVDPEARDIYTKIFGYQALRIRPAFLGLTAVWSEEIQSRATRLPELETLRVPTKIIFGAKDPYLTADLAREFDRLLPNSELYLIDNAGHYVQLDDPEAVARAILSQWPKG